MNLTPQQIEQFNEQGYLFFPEVFRPEEMAFLKEAAAEVFEQHRPEIRREKSGAPRTAFGVHLYNEAFATFARDPRLLAPAEQIFGERAYMHQFKVNAMAAYLGELWWWHQDFATWRDEDGMPEPRAMNVAVYLDEVMHVNGPLMVIPKSHRRGLMEPRYDETLVSHHGLYMKQEKVGEVVAEGGITVPVGKPGSMLMFHANTVHGSTPNISPFPRNIVYLTLNAVSNHLLPGKQTRPDHIAHRDYAPIEPGPVDGLLRLMRERAAQAATA